MRLPVILFLLIVAAAVVWDAIERTKRAITDAIASAGWGTA